MLLSCTAFTIAQLPSVARAADSEAEHTARQHFHKGESYYATGAFKDALAEYQAGYDAVPLPGFLVNIAQCQRRLGDLNHARATYQKFVLVAPDSPLVPEVRKLIAEVDRSIADTGSTGPAGGDSDADSEHPGDEVLAPGGSAVLSTPELAPADDGSRKAPPTTATAPARVAAVSMSTAGAPMLVQSGAPPPTTTAHRRWWLWGTIGAAVIGGSIAALVLSRPDAPATIHDGTLGTLRR